MPTIVDHDHIVALLDQTWSAIADFYAELDESSYAKDTCLSGWSVKDQLSHIVATELSLGGEPVPDVDVSAALHLHNDIAAMNERWIESMRPMPGAEILARFRTVTPAWIQSLDGMGQADFDAPSWTPAGPDETYGRFMRIRHYDSFIHEHDSREALGVPSRVDHGAIASCLEEPASALGYIVGRRARIPAGHRVRIDLTGHAACTYRVAVDERAKVVAALAGGPTVHVELPTSLFLRLTAGRCDPLPCVGHQLKLGGDTELALQLASHLAFTI